MFSIGESLKQLWLHHGIELRSGTSEKDLRKFENKYNVLLPDDLKDYFATVDGFDDSDVDENFITFFPLAEVVPLNKAWHLKTVEANSCFVFADFSISAHVYAIRLTEDLSLGNQVVIAYDENPVQIANCFSEFVQGYITNDYNVLFPQWQAEQIITAERGSRCFLSKLCDRAR